MSWSMFGLHIGWWKFRNKAIDRALILVRQGVFYTLEFGRRINTGKYGEIYAYGDKVAYVLSSAAKMTVKDAMSGTIKTNKTLGDNRGDFEVYEDERLLFVVDGEVVTTPVQGTGIPMDQDMLSKFNRGDAMKQALESLRDGKKGMDWGSMKWLLLIAGIAIIVFVVWKFVLKGHMPGAVTTPGNTTTPMPSPSPEWGPMTAIYQWALWGMVNV